MTSGSPGAQQELDAFVLVVQEVVDLLAGDPAALASVAASVSGWSALAHLAHVSLANELVLKNLASLHKGSGMLVLQQAQPDPEALRVLASGVLPRGAQSPRMVRPPADIDIDTGRAWAAGVVEQARAFAASRPAGALQPLWIPHQVLGPLTFAEWARFGAMHTRHHLGIAREVLAAR